MTKAEFIKAKLTAHTPQFKNMIGLKPDFSKGETLKSFVNFAHPKAEKTIGEVSAIIHGKHDIYYTMFGDRIMKNNHTTEKITMYLI